MKILEFLLILLVGALSAVFVGCPVTPVCTTGDERCDAAGRQIEHCDYTGTWVIPDPGSCLAPEYCVDPEGEEPPRCTCDLWDTRCSSDETKVEVCNDQEAWEELDTCDEGEGCRVYDYDAECIFLDACSRTGSTRCSADNSEVETCSDNRWTATELCDEGEVCEVVDSAAQCVATGDDCTTDLDALRCNPDDDVWIQECRNVGTMETPKMEWRDSTDCSEGSPDEICIEDPNVGSSPMCGLP